MKYEHKNKLYRENVLQKTVQDGNFQELTAQWTKLKITIIRNRKSVETIKSERSGKIMRDNYMPNIVWLQ